jgi:hypothetical protein
MAEEVLGIASSFVLGLVLAFWVGHGRPAPTLPTHSNPPVKFVQIDRPGEHQKTGRDEFLASPGGAREPTAREDSGALDADVVAALRHLAKMINQRCSSGRFAVSRASPCSSADKT